MRERLAARTSSAPLAPVRFLGELRPRQDYRSPSGGVRIRVNASPSRQEPWVMSVTDVARPRTETAEQPEFLWDNPGEVQAIGTAPRRTNGGPGVRTEMLD